MWRTIPVSRLLCVFYHERALVVAIRDYTQATELNPGDPSGWNNLCWYGSLWGRATDVMAACEKLVALKPDDGWFHDSRGLARALSGDYAGAAEDFKIFVAWSKEHAQYEQDVAERKA